MVTVYGGAGKPLQQRMYERAERVLLSRSAGVGRLHGGVASTHIAYSYGVGVVAAAVSAGKVERSAGVNVAFEVDEIMVANAVESAGAMPAVDVGYGNFASGGCGGAVDDDFCDLTHNFRFLIKGCLIGLLMQR